MPITIYPGTVKKRNLNGTYSDLVPGADANPQLANDIAEEYDPVAGVYSVGDYCIYQSVLYKCITAISIPEAFDNIKWTDVSVAEELTSQRNTLTQVEENVGKIIPVITGTTNNSGYTINPGDYFEANGALYQLPTTAAAIPIGGTWSGTAQGNSALNGLKNAITALLPTYAQYIDLGNVAQGGTFTVPKDGFYEAYGTNASETGAMVVLIRTTGGATVCRLEETGGGAVSNLVFLRANSSYVMTTKVNVERLYLYY